MSLQRTAELAARICVLVLSLLGASAAWAQTCSFQHKLSFADGSVGCLTSYPELATRKVEGFNSSLQDLMPQHGALAVAASAPSATCPLRVGVGRLVGSFTPNVIADQNFVIERKYRALAACDAGAGAKPGCGCTLILSDGQSPLAKADFEARFGAGSAPGEARRREQPAETDRLPAEVDERHRPMQASPRTQPPATPIALPAVPAKARVRALVIGNSAYTRFGRLPNPRNDAEAIARKFRAMGIDVDLALDLNRDAFVRVLNQYSVKAVGQDVNILYYAGHGVQVEGVNYFVPTDMSADGVSAGYVKLNGISLNAALDYLPAKTRLVFLDACRDNPVSRNLMTTRGAGSVGLAPFGAGSGTLIAYATKDGATAEDGNGRNSPYTTGLLEHLDKPFDIAVILRMVRQTVMNMTSNRQEPWEYGSLVGEQLILSQIAR
jgi:hypothetical protein